MRYSNVLTVIVRDDAPIIHCGDSPSYRSIKITLTPEQIEKINRLSELENISKCFVEVSTEEVITHK